MAGAPSPVLEQPFVWKHSAFCVGVQLVEDMINCVNYLSDLEDSPSESRLAFLDDAQSPLKTVWLVFAVPGNEILSRSGL